MPKSTPNPDVDAILAKSKSWPAEYNKLRAILLDTGGELTEDIKWGWPCYTLGDTNSNIVLIHGFKEYCALLLFKGALLKDPHGLLVRQTENVQSSRQLRFTSLGEITKQKAIIKAYVQEAIAVEKAGLKVEKKATAEYAVPEELQRRLSTDRALKEAFEALTPGRQRAYLLHFAGARQSKTRESRIENCIPRILDGLGLND